MWIMTALVTGYLLGSVLPAYLIGRSRGIDLRAVGSGNAGATNALHELGPAPALVTLGYDTLKGVAAMVFAWRLGVPPAAVYGAGIAAWAGHHFPFYLGFRGAEGAATTSGLLIAAEVIALTQGWLTPTEVLVLAAVFAVAWAISGSRIFGGMVGLAANYAVILAAGSSPAFALFLGFVVVQQMAHAAAELRKTGPIRQLRDSRRTGSST